MNQDNLRRRMMAIDANTATQAGHNLFKRVTDAVLGLPTGTARRRGPEESLEGRREVIGACEVRGPKTTEDDRGGRLTAVDLIGAVTTVVLAIAAQRLVYTLAVGAAELSSDTAGRHCQRQTRTRAHGVRTRAGTRGRHCQRHTDVRARAVRTTRGRHYHQRTHTHAAQDENTGIQTLGVLNQMMKRCVKIVRYPFAEPTPTDNVYVSVLQLGHVMKLAS